jgi:hypothetical protein
VGVLVGEGRELATEVVRLGQARCVHCNKVCPSVERCPLLAIECLFHLACSGWMGAGCRLDLALLTSRRPHPHGQQMGLTNGATTVTTQQWLRARWREMATL